MLFLRHCRLSSEDLITCERALLRFVSGRSKEVNLDFNVWDYTVPEIYGYILGMFVKLGLVECLGITSEELLDFIVDVDRGYLATFYHSFYHAADVTAVLYNMLRGMQASQYLSKPDMAALLLAGLCHDIGHPGLNNLFQVNAQTDLYKQHGEESVLEKYSCSLAMDLVTKHALFRNIAHSPSAIQPEGHYATETCMRDAMIKAILATDMSFHYDMLKNLNGLIEATTTPIYTSASEAETDTEPESEGSEVHEHKTPITPTNPALRAAESLGVMHTPSSGPRKIKSVSIASPVSTDEESLTASPTDIPVGSRSHRRQLSCDSRSSFSSVESGGSSDPHNGSMDDYSHTPADLTPGQRQNLCNCLLHAADISNAVKPWTICKRWSDLVVQEFFRQGDIEKAQGLPVSPNMDRNQHNQPQISLGFGDFVVQPYFETFAELLPKASTLVISLANNRDQWLALQQSSQQFGNDPYLAVDPLEGPSQAKRPSSPMVTPISSGRRVSVAAGVLVLDDSIPLRSLRRLRHSTNTDPSQGHPHRKMKRPLPGRSLSASLQNLYAASGRSSISSGRSSNPLASILKRQSSMIEQDTSYSSPNLLSHVQLRNFPSESGPSHSAQPPPLPPLPVSQVSDPSIPTVSDYQRHKGSSSVSCKTGKDDPGKGFRQKRLASLQVGSQVQTGPRQGYGDGYDVIGGQLSGPGHIPNSSTDHPLAVSGASDQGSNILPSSQAGNRSSTPAVMMNKIKYDWALSPTLPEAPSGSRFGYGPLDGINEHSMGPGSISDATIADGKLAAYPGTIQGSDTPVGPATGGADAAKHENRKLVENGATGLMDHDKNTMPASAVTTTTTTTTTTTPMTRGSGDNEETRLGLVVKTSTCASHSMDNDNEIEHAPITSFVSDGTVAISTASSP
ncbi:hypothetical protein BG011_008297 [Mortierella polycephala]|uniref:Phosphodiesterase n=1 Tax=Mortierella polycephala TaxID=41804 RepID=A0A9P6QED1_9FUNG|nr:hypothetical protein BG011_008297 [Mortierella polycephala]